jgi:hypothetical protein
MAASNVKVTFAIEDPNLDAEELDRVTQNLWQELRQLDEVEKVDRVADPNPPEGNKSFCGLLVGILTAEVNAANIKFALGYLRDRLVGKPIKLALKAPDGREIHLEANNTEEFEFVMQKAEEFLQGKVGS